MAAREEIDLNSLESIQEYWTAELDRSEKVFKNWHETAKKYWKRFLNEDRNKAQGSQLRYPILWENISTLRPNVWSRAPLPIVERRFHDDDPAAAEASEILEKALSYIMERDDFEPTMLLVRDDFLMTGRGTAWLRYEFEQELRPVSVPADQIPAEVAATLPADVPQIQGPLGIPLVQIPTPVITEERVCYDFVSYKDFLHEPARHWAEVTWAARRVWMTRDEIAAQFGKDRVETLTFGDQDGQDDEAVENKTPVFEIWDKKRRLVFFIAKGSRDALGKSEPFLDLENFFPFPKPVYSTVSNETMVPVPDYRYYEDTAKNLDTLTQRIHKLQLLVKMRGFYPASGEEAAKVKMAFQSDDVLIAVDNWTALSEKGGASGIIEWFPLDMLMSVLQALRLEREALVDEVYKITGISDIVRGTSNPTETATAQSIKAQYVNIKVKERVQALALFSRDMIKISAEILAQTFQRDTLARMTNQEVSDEVYALLRDNQARDYRIDVEADSTINPDEASQKRDVVEFLGAFGQFMGPAINAAQQEPELAPLMGQMLEFAVRRFRVGRSLESDIKATVDRLTQKAAMATQQPKPDPLTQKHELEMAKIKLEQQRLELMKYQIDEDNGTKRMEIELKSQLGLHGLAVQHIEHLDGIQEAAESAPLVQDPAAVQAAANPPSPPFQGPGV